MEIVVMYAFGVFIGGGIIFILFAPHFPWLKHRSEPFIINGSFRVWEDIKGRAHRADGPALETLHAVDGDGVQWYWHGKQMTLNDWCKIAKISKKKKAILLLTYR